MKWFPTHVNMPAPPSSERVINAVMALTDDLRHPALTGPVPPPSVYQADALHHLYGTFSMHATAPLRMALVPEQ